MKTKNKPSPSTLFKNIWIIDTCSNIGLYIIHGLYIGLYIFFGIIFFQGLILTSNLTYIEIIDMMHATYT